MCLGGSVGRATQAVYVVAFPLKTHRDASLPHSFGDFELGWEGKTRLFHLGQWAV